MKISVSVLDSSSNIFRDYSENCSYKQRTRTVCGISDGCSDITTFLDYSPDDNLKFKCVLEFMEFRTESSELNHTDMEQLSATLNLSILTDDLKNMYLTSLCADLSLKLADSEIRVHRSVLCARSPVFAKMFETPMDEDNKNVVKITDIEQSTLKDFVEFLYTGQLHGRDFESAYSLYAVADKYDVLSLRKTCRDVLLSKMDVENACRILVMADRHSDNDFKKACMDYAVFNFEGMLKTKAWDEFAVEYIHLAEELRQKCKEK